MADPADPDQLVGLAAIGAYLGCTPSNASRLASLGRIPAEKVDGVWTLVPAALREKSRPDPDRLIGVAAIAAFLGRSRGGVMKLIRTGRLPAVMQRGRLTASSAELAPLFPGRRPVTGDDPDVLRGTAAIAAFLRLDPKSVGYHVREGSFPTFGTHRDRIASRRELARLMPDHVAGRRHPSRPTDVNRFRASPPDAPSTEPVDPDRPRKASLMASVAKRTWTSPDGTKKSAWAVRYVDPEGNRRQQTFTRKRDADAARHSIEVELRAGTHVASNGTATILAVSDLYLRHLDQRARAGEVGRCYLRNTETIIRLYVEPRIGGLTFGRLGFLQVEAWQRDLTAAGVSIYTARKALQIMTRVEAFAAKRRLTVVKAFQEVSRDTRRLPPAKIRTFTFDEARRLLAVAAERGVRGVTDRRALLTECFVNLAALCGLRIGEISALTPAHLDFDRSVILIRQNLTSLDELKPPKTAAGVRDVAMPPRVAGLLKCFIAAYAVRNPRKLVFLSEGGRGLPARSMSRYTGFHVGYWRPLLRRAGLDHPNDRFHFHALRHFAASNMIENGLSLPDVAQLLGHQKFDMTLQTYAHPIIGPARHHAVAASMEAALRCKSSDVAERAA